MKMNFLFKKSTVFNQPANKADNIFSRNTPPLVFLACAIDSKPVLLKTHR